MRAAALPVGAASAMRQSGSCASRQASRLTTVVVLPVPGPPLMTVRRAAQRQGGGDLLPVGVAAERAALAANSVSQQRSRVGADRRRGGAVARAHQARAPAGARSRSSGAGRGGRRRRGSAAARRARRACRPRRRRAARCAMRRVEVRRSVRGESAATVQTWPSAGGQARRARPPAAQRVERRAVGAELARAQRSTCCGEAFGQRARLGGLVAASTDRVSLRFAQAPAPSASSAEQRVERVRSRRAGGSTRRRARRRPASSPAARRARRGRSRRRSAVVAVAAQALPQVAVQRHRVQQVLQVVAVLVHRAPQRRGP